MIFGPLPSAKNKTLGKPPLCRVFFLTLGEPSICRVFFLPRFFSAALDKEHVRRVPEEKHSANLMFSVVMHTLQDLIFMILFRQLAYSYMSDQWLTGSL